MRLGGCRWGINRPTGVTMNWQQAEKLCCDILTREGWEAKRVKDKRGNYSRGPFDVIASRNQQKKLIQVKLRKANLDKVKELAYSLRREYRRRFCLPPFSSAEIWVFYPNRNDYNIFRLPI